jgi:hypothetical protein
MAQRTDHLSGDHLARGAHLAPRHARDLPVVADVGFPIPPHARAMWPRRSSVRARRTARGAGLDRRPQIVLAGLAAGMLLIAGACALVGSRIEVLDFVAPTITLVLGIDSAIKFVYHHARGRTGFVCSLRLTIGCHSLAGRRA